MAKEGGCLPGSRMRTSHGCDPAFLLLPVIMLPLLPSSSSAQSCGWVPQAWTVVGCRGMTGTERSEADGAVEYYGPAEDAPSDCDEIFDQAGSFFSQSLIDLTVFDQAFMVDGSDTIYTDSFANVVPGGFSKGAIDEDDLVFYFWTAKVAWHEAVHWWCMYGDGPLVLECPGPGMGHEEAEEAIEDLVRECHEPPNRLIPEDMFVDMMSVSSEARRLPPNLAAFRVPWTILRRGVTMLVTGTAMLVPSPLQAQTAEQQDAATSLLEAALSAAHDSLGLGLPEGQVIVLREPISRTGDLAIGPGVVGHLRDTLGYEEPNGRDRVECIPGLVHPSCRIIGPVDAILDVAVSEYSGDKATVSVSFYRRRLGGGVRIPGWALLFEMRRGEDGQWNVESMGIIV
jgi:hypothetical protein